MGAIQDIFITHGPAYLEKFGADMPDVHRQAMDAIISCRSPIHGFTVYECEKCGKTHYIYRGCGNRHCPTCQSGKALNWMDAQLEKLLPGNYFLITFTVPEEMRPFMRSHQRVTYNALFTASSQAVKMLAPDEKHLGGDLPGFFGVLHTWGRQMQYHPHIHYIAPGGAFNTQDGQWHCARPNFYLPVKALSKIYRAKFRDAMLAAGLLDQIDPMTWETGWNVNIQAVGGGRQTVRYLSHYVFKVAISDYRIVASEDGTVTFSYRKPGSNRERRVSVSAFEFIRRYLQHVLPAGFMKIRYYGFMNANSSVSLDQIRALIELQGGFEIETQHQAETAERTLYCPDCGGKLLYRFSILPHMMIFGPGAG
ncbi:MAG: transposase [bacterium]|nr:transposase [bacterium]